MPARERGDRQRRRVRREDRSPASTTFSSSREELALRVEVLDDRLDDELRATQTSGSASTVAMRARGRIGRRRGRACPWRRACRALRRSAAFAASPAPIRVSCSCTRWPCCAAICAMPAPIAPAPMTATIGSARSSAPVMALRLAAGELRRPLGQERRHAFAIVVAVAELALQVALEVELRRRACCRRTPAARA